MGSLCNVNAGIPQDYSWPFPYANIHCDLPDNIIYNIAILTDDTTDRAS